ncbi:MAG: hypothetical protein IJY39_11060 [Clostridia bacterium]|nr:hypothetical protein [Clostridia bacterium]
MKKFVYVMVALLLILALTSCDIEHISVQFDDAILENANVSVGISGGAESESGSVTDQSSDTSEEDQTPSENESNSDTDQSGDTSEVDQTPSKNESNSNTDQSGNTSKEDQTPNKNQNTSGDKTNQNNNTTATLENVNNGVLKEASTETMSVPANMELRRTEGVAEENNSVNIQATVVLYTLDGDVVKWFTENDFIYVITSGNNRLVVIDTKTMLPVSNIPLAGEPAEINSVGNKIYISLPDLCRIDVFSKSNCVKESSLYFDHEVSSFCIDGNYIYYSEHDQFCKVFKKNLVTNELTMVQNTGLNTFYFPKLYLNEEDRILYIGESGSTGSALYYYDADTLALKSVFKKNDYGIMNHTREIFHLGDEIFWGNYRLSDTNAKELVGR